MADLGVAATLSADALVGHALAKSVESPHAGAVLLKLVDGEAYRIIERAAGPEDLGRRLSELRGAPCAALLMAVIRGGAVELGLSEDVTVQDGDQLVWVAKAGVQAGRH
jgi:Trk K+ transport system NAD-binding subunit